MNKQKQSAGVIKSQGKAPLSEPFSNKFAGLRPAALLKRILQQSCLSNNVAKFLRTPFYTKHWLLLNKGKCIMSVFIIIGISGS